MPNSAKKCALIQAEKLPLPSHERDDISKDRFSTHRMSKGQDLFSNSRYIGGESMLELGEGLLGAGRLGHLQGVVLHSLAQWPER